MAYILYNETTVNCEYPTEKYGSWYEEKNIKPIIVVNDFDLINEFKVDNHEQIQIIGEPTNGDMLFVVCSVYESGDSFGNATGNVEFFFAFADIHEAIKFKKSVDNIETFSVVHKYKVNDVEILIYIPWSGYFERKTDVYIETLQYIK